MKFRSITISGPVASGTTTTAKALALKLKLEYKAAGDVFRKYMLENNIPLPNKEEIPDEVERAVDDDLKALMKSRKSVVLEGLYLGYFARSMPHVLKVLLICDEKVRIKRALDRTHTHKETAEDVIRRDKAHDLKFRHLYADEDFLNKKFFDLVIDTSNTGSSEVVEKILKKFRS
ncbi:hypothetical protein A2164_02200 [Candidatus Curtissbacteria bacterium RBG_13_35_7]|uniref:(d)CMP kinase n=1 Tax=Candidatus Curtissbacteria bacterium RBG_13_35_7 TaxID=1797705 RepID=A0A1F5G1A7_9BACT|nr:MAG: hypothetical protein A2164_02200 [Candidatus Curtissbacteria bacterium RBG_13_35_7]